MKMLNLKKSMVLLCLAALILQPFYQASMGIHLIPLPPSEDQPVAWLGERSPDVCVTIPRPMLPVIFRATKPLQHLDADDSHLLKMVSITYYFLTFQPPHYPFIAMERPKSQFTADL